MTRTESGQFNQANLRVSLVHVVSRLMVKKLFVLPCVKSVSFINGLSPGGIVSSTKTDSLASPLVEFPALSNTVALNLMVSPWNKVPSNEVSMLCLDRTIGTLFPRCTILSSTLPALFFTMRHVFSPNFARTFDSMRSFPPLRSVESLAFKGTRNFKESV